MGYKDPVFKQPGFSRRKSHFVEGLSSREPTIRGAGFNRRKLQRRATVIQDGHRFNWRFPKMLGFPNNFHGFSY